jgi:hypothetical protein
MAKSRQHWLGRKVIKAKRWLRALRRFRKSPARSVGRWAKRKLWRTKTTRVMRHGELGKRVEQKAAKRAGAPDRPMQRRGYRHDFVPGRSIVEWLEHPELGRGRVLALWNGDVLDVEFETNIRPPAGVPIEEVRLLVRA